MLDNDTIDWIVTVGVNDGDIYRNVTKHIISYIAETPGARTDKKSYFRFLKVVDLTINELKKLALKDDDIGERLPYRISPQSKMQIAKEFLAYYQEEINLKAKELKSSL
jgi:hypothetical protein